MNCSLVCRARSTLVALAIVGSTVASSLAAGGVDRAYVKSLAAPAKTVLVIEYYDGNRVVVGREGYASASGYKAVSPTDIKVNDKVTLHLFGLEPCQGDMVNRRDGYAGTCGDYAEQQLQITLKSPRVVLCRAFLSEQNARLQDATCFGYHNYPGSLDTVDNIEEQLVSLGALRLSRKADGSPLRPDLAPAERIGRRGYGMWSDPRIQSQ